MVSQSANVVRGLIVMVLLRNRSQTFIALSWDSEFCEIAVCKVLKEWAEAELLCMVRYHTVLIQKPNQAKGSQR